MSGGVSESPPVFIVGAPRSGTSILYRVLLRHPSFAVIGDQALQLAESGLLDSLASAPKWQPERPRRLWLYFLADAEAYGRFLEDIRPATAVAGPVSVDSRPPWTRAVLQAFVLRAAEARSCRRLLEKTPTHIERAAWILEALPNAQLLFIHRHPLDTYTSYVRRAEVDPGAGWARLSIEEFADTYRRHATAARRLRAGFPSRFLMVGYERFTSAPQAELERVCSFLGEVFDPVMVSEPNPDLRRARHDPHLFGEITQHTKAWEDYLEPAQAGRLWDLCRPPAEALGYSFPAL